MNPPLPQLPVVVSNEQTQNFVAKKDHDYSNMPLVTYSDGSYVNSGSDYWFVVGPCEDVAQGHNQGSIRKSVKVGYHRQGDLLENEEFQLPKYNATKSLERGL